MTYRFNFNSLADESVEAGMLLRSTVEGFFTTRAFVHHHLSKFAGGANRYDLDDIAVDCLIYAVEEFLGSKVTERTEVWNLMHRVVSAIMSRHKQALKEQGRFLFLGEKNSTNPEMDISATVKEWRMSQIDYDRYEEDICSEAMYIISEKHGKRVAKMIELRANGMMSKDIAELFGVTKQYVHALILKVARGAHSSKIKQILAA